MVQGDSKPSPDISQTALSRLAPTLAAAVLVVGDTPCDVEAVSQRAGCIATYRDLADPLTQYAYSPLAAG